MASKIGLLHSGGKPIWQCVARWANHLVTVCNSQGHSYIQLVRSSCDLKGEYTTDEADDFSIADILLGEEAWAPYPRHTVNSYRGDEVYTEIIVSSHYNSWAMLRNSDRTDTSTDSIIQDHIHLLSTNQLWVRILTQCRQGYEILSTAVGSSLNNDPATVKKEVIKRALLSNIPLDGKQLDISWE